MKIQGKRLFAVAILSAAIAAQAQDSSSNPGISAFNEGRYQEALTHFEQQEREASSTDSLQYNIAVSLFRLQRYDEAKQRFQSLVDKPQWQVLVQYNLGLLAQAQGQREEAMRLFRAGAQQQENERVATLARSKLAELETAATTARPPTPAPAKRFSSVVSLSGGDDSNATSLASDLLDSSNNAGDSFHELLAFGQYQISGSARDGLNVYALGFDRAFNEFSRLDSRVLGGGFGYVKPFGGYQFETGLRLTRTSLDSEEVADQTQLSLGVSKALSFGTLNLDLRVSRFDAARPYAQIDGEQQQLELGWRKSVGDFTFKTRYRYEENDRQDLQRGGAFSSYSPTRHALRAEMRWQASAKLSTGLAAEYIDSQYEGLNRLREIDGSIKQAQREGEQRKLNADIAYRLNPNWLVRAQYQLTDQRDNFDIYQYDKHRVFASIEFQY